MKLSETQVKQMRLEYVGGGRPQDLAKAYGISLMTAYKYLRGRGGDLSEPQTMAEQALCKGQGEFLKALRKLLGMTQVELAIQVKKSPSTIGNWETGETTMKVTDRRKLLGWIAVQGLMADVSRQIAEPLLEGQREGEEMGNGCRLG